MAIKQIVQPSYKGSSFRGNCLAVPFNAFSMCCPLFYVLTSKHKSKNSDVQMIKSWRLHFVIKVHYQVYPEKVHRFPWKSVWMSYFVGAQTKLFQWHLYEIAMKSITYRKCGNNVPHSWHSFLLFSAWFGRNSYNTESISSNNFWTVLAAWRSNSWNLKHVSCRYWN